MSTVHLFIQATGPLTCLNLFRHWIQSFSGGCARQLMSADAKQLLLPSTLNYTGLRKGRMFKTEKSEFPSSLLTRPEALASLNGLKIPPEFIDYFQSVINERWAIPLPVLDLFNIGAADIESDVEAALLFYSREMTRVQMIDEIAAIRHPTAIFLHAESPLWSEFWSLATKYRVSRKASASQRARSLDRCAYVVDLPVYIKPDIFNPAPLYGDPDAFFANHEKRHLAAADYWIITRRDAFLLLFILRVTHPLIRDTLKVPVFSSS